MLRKLVKVTDPVDEAISDVLVTMHGISDGSGQQQLGSTIWTEVRFEGWRPWWILVPQPPL